MLDGKDKKILSLLQGDARIPSVEIARQVGMAPSAIHERIKKLEQAGVISGYETRLDPKALGLNLIAFIFVKTVGGVGEWSTGEQLAKMPEVQEVHSIAGEDCYLVKVRVRDPEALGQLLRERLGKIKTIVNTNSVVVLSTLKESGQLPLALPKESRPA